MIVALLHVFLTIADKPNWGIIEKSLYVLVSVSVIRTFHFLISASAPKILTADCVLYLNFLFIQNNVQNTVWSWAGNIKDGGVKVWSY